MGRFLELSVAEVKELHGNLLKNWLPKSTLFHNMVTLFLNDKLNEVIPTQIFAYNRNYRCDDAFLVARQDKSKFSASPTTWILCAPDSIFLTNAMFDALGHLVDWSVRNSFTCVHADICAPLKHRCEMRGNGTLLEWQNRSAYCLSDTPVTKIQSPEATIVKLDAHGVKQVVKYWDYTEEANADEVSAHSAFVGSAGIIVNDELVSWAFAETDGAIKGLYTLEDHRGKGYAKMVLQTLGKILAEKGLIAVTDVEDNVDSKNLMEDSGYEFLYKMYWVEYLPE